MPARSLSGVTKASTPTTRKTTIITFSPRGAAREIFTRKDPEILLAGPAGTGKSRAWLEKLHHVLQKYPYARGLMVRKTHTSLTASALVTYQRKVLHPLDGVVFYGGSPRDPPEFRYPNGSRLLMGGMDKPDKILSTEYDIIFVNEATELTEDDWEKLSTRLRNGIMPYQQLVADANPGPPTHWLKLRADAGRLALLESRHEDNPEIFTRDGAVTEKGREYLARLDSLTGVRFLRLRKGVWAAAEGMVYDGWERGIHLIDRFEVPKEWPRYWAVDFGYTHPFVWQEWAEDPDGRLYRLREIYQTRRLVEDHARQIKAITADSPRPIEIICDHDAEDRATLERHLDMMCTPAHKAVSPGIQAVASRLKVAGDGKPRIFFLRDSLVERDPYLEDAKRPTCSEEEFESYVWNLAGNRRKGEEPIKEHDHGLDALRYVVAQRDLIGTVGYGPSIW